MLVKIKDVLVPHDMDMSLLDFILADEGKSRWTIGIHIPEAKDYPFAYDTCHINVNLGELRVHSQVNSREYELYMYAWEHVYCLMPSAKAKRKVGAGWISPNNAGRIALDDPRFATTYHSRDFAEFLELHRDQT